MSSAVVPRVAVPPPIPFVKVTRTINRAVEEVFPKVIEADLTVIFPSTEDAPGIVSTSISEGWNMAGLRRVNTSSDGSTSEERMLTVVPNRSFSYELDGFTAPALADLDRIHGAWAFIDNGNGTTSIEWIYELYPKTPQNREQVETTLRRRYASRLELAMEILKQQIERDERSSPD